MRVPWTRKNQRDKKGQLSLLPVLGVQRQLVIFSRTVGFQGLRVANVFGGDCVLVAAAAAASPWLCMCTDCNSRAHLFFI